MLKLPDEIVLDSDPSRVVARPVLILTAYLADDAAWSRHHLSDVLRLFVNVVGADRLPFYTTSLSPDWLRVRPAEVEQLIDDARNLWWRGSVRHHFWLRIQDVISAPSVGFSYREVDSALQPRSGFLQVTLPLDHATDDLLQLTLAVAHTGAVHSAVAGYGYSYDPWFKSTAFWEAYRSCRRYLGVDIQDPDQMAWHARAAVPGTNWLTVLSDSLLATCGVERAAIAEHRFASRVQALALPTAVVLRAGDQPEWGDRNLLSVPAAYAEVAQLLAPHFPVGLQYWGGFAEHAATDAWLHRFDQPSGWL